MNLLQEKALENAAAFQGYSHRPVLQGGWCHDVALAPGSLACSH